MHVFKLYINTYYSIYTIVYNMYVTFNVIKICTFLHWVEKYTVLPWHTLCTKVCHGRWKPVSENIIKNWILFVNLLKDNEENGHNFKEVLHSINKILEVWLDIDKNISTLSGDKNLRISYLTQIKVRWRFWFNAWIRVKMEKFPWVSKSERHKECMTRKLIWKINNFLN